MSWEEFYAIINENVEKVNEIAKSIKKGTVTFKHRSLKQEGLLHPCTDPDYKYQFTFFDEKGAIGDCKRNTIEEMAKAINDYGFHVCLKEELRIIS